MELGDGFRDRLGHDRAPEQGVVLSAVTPELLDASLRLVRLLEKPAETGVLGPLGEREITNRLICSDRGVGLWQIANVEGRLKRLIAPLGRWHADLGKPITGEGLGGKGEGGDRASH